MPHWVLLVPQAQTPTSRDDKTNKSFMPSHCVLVHQKNRPTSVAQHSRILDILHERMKQIKPTSVRRCRQRIHIVTIQQGAELGGNSPCKCLPLSFPCAKLWKINFLWWSAGDPSQTRDMPVKQPQTQCYRHCSAQTNARNIAKQLCMQCSSTDKTRCVGRNHPRLSLST